MWSFPQSRQVAHPRRQTNKHLAHGPYRHLAFEELESRRLLATVNVTAAGNTGSAGLEQLFLPVPTVAAPSTVTQTAFPVPDTLPDNFVRTAPVPAAGTPHNPLQLEAGGGGFAPAANPTAPEGPMPQAVPQPLPAQEVPAKADVASQVGAAARDAAFANYGTKASRSESSKASQLSSDKTNRAAGANEFSNPRTPATSSHPTAPDHPTIKAVR